MSAAVPDRMLDPICDMVVSVADAAVLVPAQRIGGPVEIDLGMRRWFESCRCGMHDAYPEIVAALDAEKATSPS